MTDLEMTKLCAEAMGWRVEPWQRGEDRKFRVYDGDEPIYGIGEGWVLSKWRPLTDDEQAMALVKKFRLDIGIRAATWFCTPIGINEMVMNHDLNRAIVECVAIMQKAKAA